MNKMNIKEERWSFSVLAVLAISALILAVLTFVDLSDEKESIDKNCAVIQATIETFEVFLVEGADNFEDIYARLGVDGSSVATQIQEELRPTLSHLMEERSKLDCPAP